jgi:hypothetical protein
MTEQTGVALDDTAKWCPLARVVPFPPTVAPPTFNRLSVRGELVLPAVTACITERCAMWDVSKGQCGLRVK